MGTGNVHRKKGGRAKNKQYKKKTWLCHREKDIDQIQEEIEKSMNNPNIEISQHYDDELPGGGLFYCIETDKYFISARALSDHKKSRYFKKRCKEIKEEKYTQDFADWAGGMTKEVLPSVHENKISCNSRK